jgi:tetratricopeptide (TPR) repeat protein
MQSRTKKNEDTHHKIKADVTDDFASRVLLVHPLQSNSILNCLYDIGKDHLAVFDPIKGQFDAPLSAVNAIVKDNTMLTDDAVIGSHLSFTDDQYTDSFVDRPHIHWWWNGLFHANSGGDWETSLIAYIEPLSSFQNVMGCAPYDTMTMGSHQLSSHSCILVPQDSVDELKERLQNYEGRIIGFDPKTTTLRQAINQTIHNLYPQAFKLVNINGVDINELVLSGGDRNFDTKLCDAQDYDQYRGYFRKLFLKFPDAQIEPLMLNGNDIAYQPYKMFSTGRYVGLHSGSPTDNERNALINLLKKASKNPALIFKKENQSHFVGASSDVLPHQLCVIEAYAVYNKLLKLDPNTGAHDYARYLLKKAFIADYRSIYHANGHHDPLDRDYLKSLIETNFEILLQKIDALAKSGTKYDITAYRNTLSRSLDVSVIADKQDHTALKTEHMPDPKQTSFVSSTPSSSSPHGFWYNHRKAITTVGVAAVLGCAGAYAYYRSFK